MSKQKHTKKGGIKRERGESGDEFALDLVDVDAPKKKSSRKMIDDSDVDGVDAQESAKPRNKEPVTYPCGGCQLQLQVEVDACPAGQLAAVALVTSRIKEDKVLVLRIEANFTPAWS